VFVRALAHARSSAHQRQLVSTRAADEVLDEAEEHAVGTGCEELEVEAVIECEQLPGSRRFLDLRIDRGELRQRGPSWNARETERLRIEKRAHRVDLFEFLNR
jgi:hypothetical protein